MIFDANTWKRITYTAWSPFYNGLVRLFDRMRRRSIERLNLQPGERVLIVGAGTGVDLDYLPAGLHITAIDLTPAMLAHLRQRAARLGVTVDARIMNGHVLEFSDESFDAVILHLILAVIPDPIRCVREVSRVLRSGGRVVIMDKFVPDNAAVPLVMTLLSPLAHVLGTEMTRKLGPILDGSGLRVVYDEAAGMRGFFRIILACKERV
jgi:phosphatidylethanolamine/phosphatidyl-N-methylethanolamine N-methyltransferase